MNLFDTVVIRTYRVWNTKIGGCLKIYEFEKFQDFFQFHFSVKNVASSGKKMTMQEIATEIGYCSPATISMIASGERLPSKVFLSKLLEFWKVPKIERQRIYLKVELEKLKRKDKSNLALIDKYSQLNYHKIDMSYHKLISNWYVLVIKNLIMCPDFVEDLNFIHRKLRRKVSKAKIDSAIKLLLDAKLVERNKDTGKLETTKAQTETSHDIPSEAIRANHRGMINLALDAIEEQTVSQRQFNSVALQFDTDKLIEAKQALVNFIKEFNEKYNTDNSNRIYQLNVQFFEHTNGDPK